MRTFKDFLNEVGTVAGPGIGGGNAGALYNNLNGFGDVAVFPNKLVGGPVRRKFPGNDIPTDVEEIFPKWTKDKQLKQKK